MPGKLYGGVSAYEVLSGLLCYKIFSSISFTYDNLNLVITELNRTHSDSWEKKMDILLCMKRIISVTTFIFL